MCRFMAGSIWESYLSYLMEWAGIDEPPPCERP